MMADKLEALQQAFLGFTKRAERVSSDILHDTFVDTAPLTSILETNNNQILYGRRGTGKTHALLYLAEKIKQRGEVPIYLDLRSIGSDGSIYNDAAKSVPERSVRLVLDVLKAIGIDIFALAVDRISTHSNPTELAERLDDMEASFNEVRLSGQATVEEKTTEERSASGEGKIDVSLTGLSAAGQATASLGRTSETARSVTGTERFTLNFGRVQGTLRSVLSMLGSPRLWILIDEWSELPPDLQPHLADLLRRTFLPVENFVVKIAAIEHRSNFYVHNDRGGYVGFELGADISADLNLDDFLVFDNDQARSVDFFKRLLFRHVSASEHGSMFSSPDELVQLGFTQAPVFEELVRASEGVPRDALNLASKVVTKAWGRAITKDDVRAAARDWYQQDKASPIQANAALSKVLELIVAEVIGARKARAFLFRANTRHEIIDRLFDARVIHVLKKNISSNDAPGERYDVFKIDYGCYVELINTAKSPEGLLNLDDGTYIDVPVDDYRSIRRAILPMEMLEAA